MKVVVTGGAGFLGSNMVLALGKEGFDVVATDSLTRYGTERNLNFLKSRVPTLDFRRTEIEDIPSVIYRERPVLVYHFAAQVAVTSSLTSPLRDFKINAEGTFHIARAAADVGCNIIYTSTNKVFGDNVNKFPTAEFETRYDFAGDLKGRGISEEVSIDSNHHTPYGVSKLVGELYVREFGGIANRCSCMYGPNQFGIVDQGWLSHIAFNKHLGRPTIIYGNGKQVRDILHVSDVTDLFIRQAKTLLEKKKPIQGEVYNVGGGFNNTISLLELCRIWGVQPSFETWRPADQRVFYCDNTKAKTVFGWEPKVDKEAGINELYEWTASTVGTRSL
jgi:CDP-paratose 2-epimerase